MRNLPAQSATSTQEARKTLALVLGISIWLAALVPNNANATWCQQSPLRPACEVKGPQQNGGWTWCGAEGLLTKCRDYYKKPRACIQPPNTTMDEGKFEAILAAGSCTTGACF